MAITNAQQYQQLVNKPANGKRPGYRGPGGYRGGTGGSGGKGGREDPKQGSYSATVEDNRGFNDPSPTTTTYTAPTLESRSGPQDLGFETRGIGPYAPGVSQAYQVIGGNKYSVIPGDEQNRIDRKILEDIERAKYEEEVKQFIDEGKEFESGIPTIVGKFVDAFGRFNNPKQRAWFAKNVANNKYGYTLENYDEYEEKRRKGEINAYGRPLTDLEKQLAQGNKDGPDTGDLILREQGIMNQASETMDQETDDEDEDLRLAFRADGGRIGFRGGDAARSDIASGRNAGRVDPSGGVERPSGGGGGDNNQTVITPVKIPKPIQDVGNTAGELMFLKNVIELNPVGIMKNIGTKLILDKLISEADTEDQNTMLADGGRIGAAEGGIMDLETGRQMYFLGKLVKKATRAVKKIAKSPIGKIALLYTGAGALGNLAGGSGLAGMFRGFTSPSTFLGNVPKIFSKKGLGNILVGGKGPSLGGNRGMGEGIIPEFSGLFGKGGKLNVLSAISTASALAGMLTPEQEDQAQQLADNTGIDIEEARNAILQAAKENYAMDVRARGFKADGGLMRLGYQEGGDAEPVAKKTLPLLDMGGKEKDYRETGGFVDMGRMERADDVPARLSKNEFVFTADAVRNAGDGSVDKGAEVMYNMMKNLEAGGEVSEESQGLEGARRMFQTSQRLEEVL